MDIWGLADYLKVQGISFDAIARLDLKNTVISQNCRKEFSLDRLKVINLLAVFLASFCGGVSNPKLRDSKHLACLTLDTTAAGPRSCSKLMGASGTTGSSSQKKNPYRGIKSKEFRWSRSETVDASCLPAYTHLPSSSSCSVLFFCVGCHLQSLQEVVISSMDFWLEPCALNFCYVAIFNLAVV